MQELVSHLRLSSSKCLGLIGRRPEKGMRREVNVRAERKYAVLQPGGLFEENMELVSILG